MMPTTRPAARRARLSAADRCDRCGARAYLWVELGGGAELFFCAHHGHEHEARLRERAFVVHDETLLAVSP